MLVEWARLYGGAGIEDTRLAGRVTWEWRERNALVEAVIVSDGKLADLSDVGLRTELETGHAELLAQHGMEHLDVSQVRSKTRIVTQKLGRSLYDREYVGVRFRSNLDDGECFALFEDRAMLDSMSREPELLTNDVPELLQAASDFELIVKRVWT